MLATDSIQGLKQSFITGRKEVCNLFNGNQKNILYDLLGWVIN